MSLVIRQATLADSVLLKELGYRIYPAHFKHMWESESELDNYLECEYYLPVIEQNINNKNISWYIAEIDQLIGFAKLTWQATIPNTDISGILLVSITTNILNSCNAIILYGYYWQSDNDNSICHVKLNSDYVSIPLIRPILF